MSVFLVQLSPRSANIKCLFSQPLRVEDRTVHGSVSTLSDPRFDFPEQTV